ncbi:hypothetical protein BKA58DRAFT_402527 [Alternaria rosae]|uniref:uncharacterized protein n=1 Tax=Alternaria rosae TaxID=1187941 RepID=UPI001E8D840B|nr:uncharacterized protein BKA58DRAFT_402527 [Alternaria rosae]KAH6868124.1 hypothetical protein BKA58DRAFT_402527 [Alternaria rosae]
MKFTTPLILAIATLTMANPITNPDASTVAEANPLATRDPTCDQCDEKFRNCKKTNWSDNGSLGSAGSTQVPAILLAALILVVRASSSAGTTVAGRAVKLALVLESTYWREATLELESEWRLSSKGLFFGNGS